MAVEGAVGIAEVGLRRESDPGGDFLDAETLFHYEALRLVHPDGEGVFPKACPEDFPESRAKGCGGHASRLRKSCCREWPIHFLVKEQERLCEERRVHGIDGCRFAFDDSERLDAENRPQLRCYGILW